MLKSIPARIASVERPIDWMVITGLSLLERLGSGLKVVHSAIAGHPFGVSLPCFLQRLVVRTRGEPPLDPLGVDASEDIRHEGCLQGLSPFVDRFRHSS